MPPSDTVFRAGFGRADITTPPGPGLSGYGPEARVARGYRQRIQARAIALEDQRGERVVFAVVDLNYVPIALHREVSRRVLECAPLSADRIMLSATHTHAAPGHFSEHASYDRYGSSLPGFDAAILEFFAERTANAVLQAISALRPALAAWGEVPVWGISRIRSFDVHLRDAHELPSRWEPPSGLEPEQQHVDPTLLLLRVDTLAPGGTAPAGAFSIFALHNTGNPAANDLIDADVFARPQRDLERHIDRLNGGGVARFHVRAVHVMANGAEGDVVPHVAGIPDRDAVAACGLPVLRRELRPGGYRSPPAFERWMAAPGGSEADCAAHGRALTAEVGAALSREAIRLFDALSDSLRYDLTIGRNFESVALRAGDARSRMARSAPLAGLCARAHVGTAATAGAETGRTRLLRRRVLGFNAGLEPGGSAIRVSGDCHSPKHISAAILERSLIGRHPFEEFANLAVVRVGGTLLAVVPFEASTTVGARTRETLRRAMQATNGGDAPGRFAVLGLANGYLQYVVTRREYAEQHYEGASTLYGPASAEVFTERLARLAGMLAARDWSSPVSELIAFETYPDASRTIMPRRAPIPSGLHRSIRHLSCAADTLVLRWIDAAPGALVPADGQLLSLEADHGGGWHELGWDDHADIEIRALHRVSGGYVWEARLRQLTRAGRYRVVLLERPALGRVASAAIEWNGSRCTSPA